MNGDGMTSDNKVNPVQVMKFLEGLDFPVDKPTIVEKARENGADESIIEMLEKLPDRQYDGPPGITEELGKME